MIKQVGLREARMLKGRNESGVLWRSLGLLGLVGWSVVLPMLIGIAAGAWIDRKWPGSFSWTLTLLLAGLVLGCINAWTRIKHAQEER
jgi:ATP synthase protein I